MPSFALALSCVLGAAWFLAMDTPEVDMRSGCKGLLLVLVLVALILVAVDTANAMDPHGNLLHVDFWYDTWRNGWVGCLFPFSAPLFLGSCRHKVYAVRLSPDRIMLFAMPFLAAVSLCYLSLHAPLQRCSALTSSVAAFLNGSSSLSLLQLVEANRLVLVASNLTTSQSTVSDGLVEISMWLFSVAAQASAMTTFVSAMVHTQSMVMCAASFAAVLCAKASLERHAPVLVFAAIVGAAAALSIVEYATAADAPPPPPNLEMDTLFDDAGEQTRDDDVGSSSAFSIGSPCSTSHA